VTTSTVGGFWRWLTGLFANAKDAVAKPEKTDPATAPEPTPEPTDTTPVDEASTGTGREPVIPHTRSPRHTGRHSAGGETMGQFFVGMREATSKDLSSFDPYSYNDVESGLNELREVYHQIGGCLDDLAKRLGPDRTPFVTAFGTLMGELSQHMRNTAGGIGEAQVVLEAAHNTEIRRIKAPRAGEEMFDVERNRGGR
jgi:hypothetical protein